MAKTKAPPKATKKPAAKKPKAPPKVVDSKSSSFKAMKAQIGAITLGEALETQNSKPVISTGSHALDWGIGKIDRKFGNAGIPRRSMVEIFGSTGSGKTAAMAMILREHLRRFPDGYVGVLFTEEPDYPTFVAYLAEQYDPDRVMIIECFKPKKERALKEGVAAAKAALIEEGLERLSIMTRDPNCLAVGYDSIKGSTSASSVFSKGNVKKGEDRSYYDKETAVRALVMEKYLNHQKTDNVDATVIMINQTSESVTADFRIGADCRTKTPGGRRKEFECVLRINLESRPLKDKLNHAVYDYQPQYGWEMIFKLEKNRFSPTRGNRKVITELLFDDFNYNHAREVLEAGVYLGIINKVGKFYHFNWGSKKKACNGRDQALKFLKSQPQYVAHLATEIAPRHPDLHKIKPGTGKNKAFGADKKAKNAIDEMVTEDKELDMWVVEVEKTKKEATEDEAPQEA